MTPARCASEISKMISRYTRGGLPSDWTASDFVGLVQSYTKLVKALDGPGKAAGTQTVDDMMQNGRNGAYEAMVASRVAEEAGLKPRKKLR